LKFKKPLARQLLFWILLSSSLLTLVITCLHLYLDYRKDISAIDARLQQIENSYLPTISSALWTEDLTQLEVQVTGIKNLPEVVLVQLIQNEALLFNQGENISEYTREGRWPINYNFDDETELLGELYVVTDLLPVYQKLAEKAVITLITQGGKTFIASFIIFFIVYFLVTRHLSQIASSMKNFEITADHKNELKLERNKEIDDELGYLVDQYNTMKREVSLTFIELTEQKLKAEEVNKLKSEFLANISHEVKTPMNGVYGMAQLLVDTDLNEEQQEYLKVIKSSSVHMLELLNNILDFSKIEANKIELDIKPFDLPALIGDVVLLFQATAKEKALLLNKSVDENIIYMIEGDSVRLNQVLVNLLSNALKFTYSGTVSLTAEIVSPYQASSDSVEIKFSVTDSGIGIPVDKHDVIFDQFVQADNSTTRNYGGTGLGLSICHRLVELMGGELKLASNEKTGCCFYFTLILPVTTQMIATEKNKLAILSDLSVLVVDDYKFNTCIMADILATWKMRTFTANDLQQTIEQIQQHDDNQDGFDIILLDKCMPEADGYQVYQQISQLNLAKKPKVILTSAQAENEDVNKCDQLGIDDFLVLPAHHSQIQQVLLRHTPTKVIPTSIKHNSLNEYDQQLPTILLVEDSRINQQVCCAMLKELDCTILIADNGQEAVKLWQSEQVDLILMDCHMPIMDGFDATLAIRELEVPLGKSVPILAVTASSSDQDMKRCLEVGMNTFIAKPYVREALLEAISKNLASNTPVLSV
jgi:signal transduction histidine kinase/DNA-binding response OmpR family regulator